jgi:hypothetical protein
MTVAPSPPKRASGWEWAAPLSIYALAVIPLAWLARDQINPDGVAYIRNAMYLAQGRFAASASGYWSPLLSWCMTPLLAAGVDGLYAARIVLALWGAGLVAAGVLFLRRWGRPLDIEPAWRAAAGGVLAIGAAVWATLGITPDVMLSTCLLVYAALATDGDFVRRRWGPLWCGITGGLAFLAKAYALPFVLAHFTLAVLLHYGRDRRVPRAWGLGLAGVMLVAGPWIIILSIKYQKPTVSTVASIAHAIIGPRDKPRKHPTARMYDLEPGRISIWETPERMAYNRWSPFQRQRYLLYQARYARDTAWLIFKTVASYDALRLSLPTLAAGLFLAAWRRDGPALRSFAHLLLLAGVYCAGFTLVFFFDRYIESFIWPLTLAAALAGAACLAATPWATRRTWMRAGLLALVLASFAWSVLRPLFQRPAASAAYRELARRIEQRATPAPIASTDWKEGLYVAYHLGAPHAGVPQGYTRAEVQAQLDAHRVRMLLASHDWPLLKSFEDGRWRAVDVIDGPEGRLTLFQRD